MSTKRPLGLAVWLALVAPLVGCAAAGRNLHRAGPLDEPVGPWRQQTYLVPITEASGQLRFLHSRVCRPPGEAPARVAILGHGAPGSLPARQKMHLLNCTDEMPQWFLARGYLVVYALRRGYGETAGTWAEDLGKCPDADFVHAATETARDLSATVDYATALPFARPDGAVIMGHSGAGLGAVAYSSTPHPAVAALISMAGGRGGHLQLKPNNVCHPERLIEAIRQFGRTARVPMLWIYAENDSFFDVPLARTLQQAYGEGGGLAALEPVAPFGPDGHFLFTSPGGSAVWGPLVERYLTDRLGNQSLAQPTAEPASGPASVKAQSGAK